MHMITILYFGKLASELGTQEESLELDQYIQTTAHLKQLLSSRSQKWADALSDESIQCAVDQQLATANTPLLNARELAFFPPVTGG